MACYHFTIKTDKKPDGSRVAAGTHVEYIAREGKYQDYEKEITANKLIFKNSMHGDVAIEATETKDRLLYKSPFGSILRKSDGIYLSNNASIETCAIALGITQKLYGGSLTLAGSDTYKAQILVAANEMDLPLQFADYTLQKKYTHMQEEKNNERRDFERRGGKYRKPKECFSQPHLKQRTIQTITSRGFCLPKLSECPVVSGEKRPENIQSGMLLSSDDDAIIFNSRAYKHQSVRWDTAAARLKNVNLTANKILTNLQNQLDSVFAASHVQYINREAAFKQRGGCIYQNSHLPKWAKGSAKKFFAAADRYEGLGNVRYKEIEFALPNELSLPQQKEIINKFIENHLKDFYYTYAIHDKIGVMSNGEHNTHVHIMFSDRKLDDAEMEKERPASRFFSYPSRNPKTLADKRKGGAKKDRKWEDKARSKYLLLMREDFAKIQNEVLEKYDIPDRVDHRSLKVQREEALSIGNLRLAELLDRIPEEHIGPDHALKPNSKKVAELQKYRSYKAEYQQLLYAADLMENSISEDISKQSHNDNTKKVSDLTRSEIYKSGLEAESQKLHELKSNMINALKEVNTLNRIAVWNKNATEMAKLKFMSLEEREIWQSLKSLQESRFHWITFQKNFKEPAAHRQEALAAYHALTPELEKQINALDEKIHITTLNVKPISERLATPYMQKKIQKETMHILWEDKATKLRLETANTNLQASIDALQKELQNHIEEHTITENTYTAKQLSKIISATHDNLQLEHNKNNAALKKLESRVISYDRAVSMAKDLYVKGDFKKLREHRRNLKKKESYLAKDKILYQQELAEFSNIKKPQFWQSEEIKEAYKNKQNDLLIKESDLELQEKALEKEMAILEQQEQELTALCNTSAAKAKIEDIALGILKKNHPIAEKYELLLEQTKSSSQKVVHAKMQLQAVKKQAMVDKDGTQYKVVSGVGGGNTKAPNPSLIADAILGDSKAVQLVAQAKQGDEMEKQWNMMTEIEKDEKLNSIENLDRY